MLVISWHLLTDHTVNEELGPNYLAGRDHQNVAANTSSANSNNSATPSNSHPPPDPPNSTNHQPLTAARPEPADSPGNYVTPHDQMTPASRIA